ncbi:hypothetical protein [Bradyrhizobium roseum]|uniref:hypothetical protein n=1 Tax=Bradyrhizobium roseum TaxID=3056648 RepID=UPI0026083CA2|nr:hypothetical protein [Bradyrhizobium roseus]WKA27440.1 hypothetical protein QUH67_28290 [Bradyrhizobium roseus]
MSDSTSTTASVVIPGELQLSNPIPPPVTVPLPMIAWPDGVKNFWSGLLCLAVGVISLSTGLLCGLGLSGAFGRAGDGLSLSMVLVLTFMAVFGIGIGVGFIGAAFTCLWDAVRGDPVLEIGMDRLRDRRSGLSVPWSSVRSVGFLNGRLLSVDLQLRSPVSCWQNPFRIGVLFHRYRLIPNRVIVSVAHLDASAHVVAYTILTLVRQNGGEVISKIPHGPEMYPRLIAHGTPANLRSSPVASAPVT